MAAVAAAWAFLKATGLWKPALAILAVLGLFTYHRVTLALAHHQGVVDEKAALSAQIKAQQDANAALQADLTTLRASVTDANAKVAALAKDAQAAQSASAKALADEQAKATAWQGEAGRLLAIIAHPKATDANVCSRADAQLRALINGVQ